MEAWTHKDLWEIKKFFYFHAFLASLSKKSIAPFDQAMHNTKMDAYE